MAKVGIGVTSYNRPECLKECLEHINKHTESFEIHVATDTDEDRKGVAFRKNECLRALKDCDYVFLFDDDCFPIKDGWVEFFVGKMQFILTSHLLFLTDKLHGKTHQHVNGCHIYNNCGGVFMALTKAQIDRVGAFNEKFKMWGFEHAEYSQRISKARMNWMPYLCANRTDEYLFAHDYSTPGHCSSISNEQKNIFFRENFPKFKEPIKQIYIPL